MFYANNHEFYFETKEEQEIADSCRRLIQNAIMLWHYLHLSQLLLECDNNKKLECLDIIRGGFIFSWAHINMHGSYDFSTDKNKTYNFDLNKIMDLKVA